MSPLILEQVRSSFGVGNTSAQGVQVGSPDDLLDAFRRYVATNPERYTFDEFKSFVAAVQTCSQELPGFEYYSKLLQSYVERVPDMGWERCARQVWPLIQEAKDWVEQRKIPIEKIGVRPSFKAIPADAGGGYEIRALLCDHTVDGCDCGQH